MSSMTTIDDSVLGGPLVRHMLDSYRRWLGEDLIPRSGDDQSDAQRLFEAPFVVVAHGNEADPILCYGNRAALALWEMSFAEFTQTPSRLTAEPMHRDERARLLETTTQQGFSRDYRGIRISKTGRRFAIAGVTVWNIVDASDQRLGQAATFAQWTFLT